MLSHGLNTALSGNQILISSMYHNTKLIPNLGPNLDVKSLYYPGCLVQCYFNLSTTVVYRAILAFP